jgi:hypothetical protein
MFPDSSTSATDATNIGRSRLDMAVRAHARRCGVDAAQSRADMSLQKRQRCLAVEAASVRGSAGAAEWWFDDGRLKWSPGSKVSQRATMRSLGCEYLNGSSRC